MSFQFIWCVYKIYIPCRGNISTYFVVYKNIKKV